MRHEDVGTLKTRTFITTGLLALALLAPATLAAQQLYCEQGNCKADTRSYREREGWTQEIKGTIDAAKGVRVDASFGSIQVIGSNQDNVTFTIRKRSYRGSEDEAKRYYANYVVKIYRKADAVYVKAEWTGGHLRSAGADFQLNVPRDTQWVKGNTAGGSIEVRQINGKVTAETAGGSITLDQIKGPASVSTAGGSISVDNMGSDVALETSGGAINLGTVAGKITASTSGGSISLTSAKQGAVLETAGGSVNVKQCSELKATTAGGSMDIGDADGAVYLENAGGSIRLASAKGTVVATTAGGSIRLWRLGRGVKAETASGTIEAEIVATPSDFTESHLETTAGDVIVYLPSDLKVTVRAAIESANGHQITTEFPELKVTSEGGNYGPREIWAEGNMNGGGPVLKVHVTSGNIVFRKTRSMTSKR